MKVGGQVMKNTVYQFVKKVTILVQMAQKLSINLFLKISSLDFPYLLYESKGS